MLPRHENILQRSRAALLIVDMQEKFEHAIANFAAIERQIITLVRGSKILGLPVFYTEQYPKGLGRTSENVARHLSGLTPIEKVRFSAADNSLVAQLQEIGVNQIIIAGIEAHVCILQSALDFQNRGFQVHVVGDATGSRDPLHCDTAMARLRQQGIVVTVTESVLFELTEISATDEFKQISKLIK